MTGSTPTVAIIFERLGPYHVARLKAVAQLFPVHVIEVVQRDDTYAWSEIEELPIPRTTLFGSATRPHGQQLRRVMAQSLDRIRADAVAVPGWSADYAVAALAWCADKGVPAVLMSDSTAYDAPRVAWKEAVKRRLVNLCQAALVAGKRHIDYVRALGMVRGRIHVGYDVVDNEHFMHGARVARENAPAVRRRLGLSEYYFLASARFVPKKNLLRLLEAFSLYRRQAGVPVWDLVLLGDGELRGELEQSVRALDLQNVVHMPGFKQYDELPDYYGLASAFVHASTVEQWGLVVNEAMAAGLPVLVSECCGCVPDLVEEGRNGFTFDPCDMDALAALMNRISSDACDLRAMGRASQEIIARWTPKTFAEGLCSAVTAASAAPRPKLGWGNRLLLSTLLLR